MSTAAIKTKLTPGTRVRVINPRQIKQELKGQIFEVVEMTTDEAFKVYRNDAATDWDRICKGEKFARPTRILERSEVEVYSAGFATPSLQYREGDRVVENLNTENIQLDSLIRHGTFIDYRPMDGMRDNLYPFVRWDDGSEGYSNEDTLERSDKPAPVTGHVSTKVAEFSVGDRVQTDYSNHDQTGAPQGLQGIKDGAVGTVESVKVHASKYVEYKVKFDGKGAARMVPAQFLKPLAEEKAIAPTEEPQATAITPEVVPRDPKERLRAIEAEITEAIALVKRGRQQLWIAIDRLAKDPEALASGGYADMHDYLERQWGWKKSYRYENLDASEVFVGFLEAGVDPEIIPNTTSAMTELAKVPEGDRVEVLQQAVRNSGNTAPTAKAIKQAAAPLPKVDEFDELTEAEAEELQVYRPDSSPEAIREGIKAGYITATDDAEILYSAEGEPLVPGDCIALASTPTSLLGEVTGYTPAGRIQYTRLGQKLYIDPELVVHQRPIDLSAAKAAAPTGRAEQSVTEATEAATGDFEGLFEHGQLARWNRRFWVIGQVADYGVQLLGFTPETLSNWVAHDEVKLSAAEDPLGLTLESSCQSMLSEMVEAFGKDLVQATLETLEG